MTYKSFVKCSFCSSIGVTENIQRFPQYCKKCKGNYMEQVSIKHIEEEVARLTLKRNWLRSQLNKIKRRYNKGKQKGIVFTTS